MRNIYLFIIPVVFLFACAAPKTPPVLREMTEVPPGKKSISEPSSAVKNPRLLEGELIIRYQIKKIYRGAELARLRQKMGIKGGQEPVLYLWCAEPTDQYNQKIKGIRYSIPPANTYTDAENGNRISFWNLTSRLPISGRGTIELRRCISLVRYETDFQVNPHKVGGYDTTSHLYKFYTKNEPGIELTEEIRNTAHRIVGDEKNPQKKVHKIFEWVLRNVSYQYPPKKRGATIIFKTRKGDCGEYTYLFCALCRAVGIPARFVAGLWFADKTGFHVWAEYYLPDDKWIPADASKADSADGIFKWYYFGKLENTRLTVSKGNNLPIKNTPPWATYKNSDVENGKTPFMQFSTTVAFGVDYKVERQIKITRNELLEREKWTSFD